MLVLIQIPGQHHDQCYFHNFRWLEGERRSLQSQPAACLAVTDADAGDQYNDQKEYGKRKQSNGKRFVELRRQITEADHKGKPYGNKQKLLFDIEQAVTLLRQGRRITGTEHHNGTKGQKQENQHQHGAIHAGLYPDDVFIATPMLYRSHTFPLYRQISFVSGGTPLTDGRRICLTGFLGNGVLLTVCCFGIVCPTFPSGFLHTPSPLCFAESMDRLTGQTRPQGTPAPSRR